MSRYWHGELAHLIKAFEDPSLIPGGGSNVSLVFNMKVHEGLTAGSDSQLSPLVKFELSF